MICMVKGVNKNSHQEARGLCLSITSCPLAATLLSVTCCCFANPERDISQGPARQVATGACLDRFIQPRKKPIRDNLSPVSTVPDWTNMRRHLVTFRRSCRTVAQGEWQHYQIFPLRFTNSHQPESSHVKTWEHCDKWNGWPPQPPPMKTSNNLKGSINRMEAMLKKHTMAWWAQQGRGPPYTRTR